MYFSKLWTKGELKSSKLNENLELWLNRDTLLNLCSDVSVLLVSLRNKYFTLISRIAVPPTSFLGNVPPYPNYSHIFQLPSPPWIRDGRVYVVDCFCMKRWVTQADFQEEGFPQKGKEWAWMAFLSYFGNSRLTSDLMFTPTVVKITPTLLVTPSTVHITRYAFPGWAFSQQYAIFFLHAWKFVIPDDLPFLPKLALRILVTFSMKVVPCIWLLWQPPKRYWFLIV